MLMHQEWPHLKTAIERAIHAVETNERGGLRVHCGSAERIAGNIVKHSKGDEKDHAKKVETDVHKAKSSIELTRALPFLQEALSLASQHMGDGKA
jgi:hypothetical protein